MNTTSSSQPALSTRDSTLLLIVPCSVKIGVSEPRLAGWLRKSRATCFDAQHTVLERLLTVLGIQGCASAPAALRYWGDTGEAPNGWVAAADPVWMQAGLDKLFLQVPPAGDVDADGLQSMYADLNRQLLAESPEALLACDDRGYLLGGDGFATAQVPAAAIAGEQPDDWLPNGSDAQRYLSLNGELQMALHEHSYNRQREAAGQVPLNSLWLWGGGSVKDELAGTLPPVVANDPLLRGYALACGADVYPFKGDLRDCPSPCIVKAEADDCVPVLTAAAEAWQQGQSSRLTVVFDDVYCVFSRGLRAFFSRRGPEKLMKVES